MAFKPASSKGTKTDDKATTQTGRKLQNLKNFVYFPLIRQSLIATSTELEVFKLFLETLAHFLKFPNLVKIS